MISAEEAALPLLPSIAGSNQMRLMALTPCKSMADVRTLIVGHSQAAAITYAVVQPKHLGAVSPGPGIAEAFGIAALRRSALGKPYWDLALRLAQTRDLVISWQGNQHNTAFLIAPDPYLDFLPRALADAALEPGATLIAESAVRAHFAPSLTGLEEILQAAGHPPGCRRFILATPPPLQSAALIQQRIAREDLFADRARALGQDPAAARITPAAIRRKFWFVLQELMAETAARHGAIFLPAPVATFDAEGFLHPLYSAGDITHANLGYGIIALRELAGHLL